MKRFVFIKLRLVRGGYLQIYLSNMLLGLFSLLFVLLNSTRGWIVNCFEIKSHSIILVNQRVISKTSCMWRTNKKTLTIKCLCKQMSFLFPLRSLNFFSSKTIEKWLGFWNQKCSICPKKTWNSVSIENIMNEVRFCLFLFPPGGCRTEKVQVQKYF